MSWGPSRHCENVHKYDFEVWDASLWRLVTFNILGRYVRLAFSEAACPKDIEGKG